MAVNDYLYTSTVTNLATGSILVNELTVKTRAVTTPYAVKEFGASHTTRDRVVAHNGTFCTPGTIYGMFALRHGALKGRRLLQKLYSDIVGVRVIGDTPVAANITRAVVIANATDTKNLIGMVPA